MLRILALTAAPESQFDAIFAALRRRMRVRVLAPGPWSGALPPDTECYAVPAVEEARRDRRARLTFAAVAEAAAEAVRVTAREPVDLVFGQASFGCVGKVRAHWSGPFVAQVELAGLEYARCRPEYPLDAEGKATDRTVRGQVHAALRQADAVITPTCYSASLLPADIRARTTPVMEGFAVREALPEAARARILAAAGLDPVRPVVGFFARSLEAIRGFDRFVQAAECLAAEDRNLQFLAVGAPATLYGNEGRYLSKGLSFAEAALRASGLPEERIVFTGFLARGNMNALMDASDVAVFPIYEGAGTWSLFETLAGGTPVVASDRCFVPEVLEHGRNGLLADPDSPEALAGAVARLLAEPDLRRQIGAAAQRTIAERYSLEAAAAGYERVFRQVTRRGAG